MEKGLDLKKVRGLSDTHYKTTFSNKKYIRKFKTLSIFLSPGTKSNGVTEIK